MVTRDSRILDALDQHGSVLVSDLARELGVSEVTIRKDLDALAERELLRRTRGGALPPERRDEGAFADRMRSQAAVKQAVAAHAATLVERTAQIVHGARLLGQVHAVPAEVNESFGNVYRLMRSM